MSYKLETFTGASGGNLLFPPQMEIPILFGSSVLDPKTCERLAQEVLRREPAILAASRPAPVAGMDEGLTTRWLSYNLLAWDFPEIAPLKSVIKDAYLHYLEKAKIPRWPNSIQCWANVLRDGESLKTHHHNFRSRAVLSATVALTTSATSTTYVFPYRLQRRGTEDFVQEISFLTRKGNILLVPGWVSHSTSPNPGPAPRITLGFDIFSEVVQGSFIPFDGGSGWLMS